MPDDTEFVDLALNFRDKIKFMGLQPYDDLTTLTLDGVRVAVATHHHRTDPPSVCIMTDELIEPFYLSASNAVLLSTVLAWAAERARECE